MEIKVPRGKEVFYKDGSTHYTLVGEIQFNPSLANRLNSRLGIGSSFQKFWDNMLLTDMEQYIPKLTGTLINSGILNTVIGSGYLTWRTPYARRQYYEGRQPGEAKRALLEGVYGALAQ